MEFETPSPEKESLQLRQKNVVLAPIHDTVERDEDPNEWREHLDAPISNIAIDSETTSRTESIDEQNQRPISSLTSSDNGRSSLHLPALIGAIIVTAIAASLLALVWLTR